ncbi:MAG: carboxypeptidase-like regulatory domain-containing protein, partial [Planctomycetota bacterium]|nr:carboxypeptidase-like regulatory domain-containing protein [Planctomycetota bacterium]
VEWHPRGGRNARPGSTHSGRGGAFSLQLGSGEYVAEVVPPDGYQPTTKVVRVHSGMQRTLLVLSRAPADTDRTPEDPGPGPGPGPDPGPDPDGGGIKPPPPDQGNLTMSVQVFGREGRKTFPLGAAQVRISGRRQMFMTDHGGRLRVPLPAGRYNVTATKSGFSMGRSEIMLSRHNTAVPPIYLNRQPNGGGGGGGGITPPPPPHAVPLQIRVLVSFPKSPKKGGWATAPAKGANIRIMHGGRQVFSGRADGNGYLGTKLKPGNYQIQVSHGQIHHNEGVNIGNQAVRKTITLKSGAAVLTPGAGTGPVRRIPGVQNRGRNIPEMQNRGRIIPGMQLQRRVQ